MSKYAINHCGQRDEIEAAGLSAVDVQEAAVTRAGQIIESELSGKPSKPHKLPGVELIAQVIAAEVKKAGAKKLCGDFSIDLDRLVSHASSTHISYC